ncbi:MAG: hypothetical protein JJT94_08925, partial [Bernardetiaceae bacterium]|nr:hypothetical protein [Bernardetiaceae bacterium]
MQKTIILTLILFIFSTLATFASDDTLYQTLKEKFKLSEERESFHVFVVNPNGGSSTIGHIINKQCKAIRNQSACQDILFVLDKHIARSQVRAFFNELLRVPYDEIGAENILIDGDLYHAIALEKGMTDFLYFYNKSKYHHAILKYSDPNICRNFPYDKYKLEFVSDVLLDSNYYQSMAAFYTKSLDDAHIIQWSDMQGGRVALVNKKTGTFSKVFDKNEISVVDLYAQHIDSTAEAVARVIEGLAWLKENNRPSIPVYNVYTDTDGKSIYIVYAIQVKEALREDIKRRDKDGKPYVDKKGKIVHNIYRFIAKCNKNLEIIDNYYVPLPAEEQGGGWLLPSFDDILIVEDTIWTTNNAQNYTENNKLSDKYSDILVAHVIDEKTKQIKPVKTLIPKLLENSYDLREYILDHKITFWKNKKIILRDTDSLIYEFGADKPFYKIGKHLQADSITESLTYVNAGLLIFPNPDELGIAYFQNQ